MLRTSALKKEEEKRRRKERWRRREEKERRKEGRKGNFQIIKVCPIQRIHHMAIDKLDLILISIPSQTNEPFYGIPKMQESSPKENAKL